MRHALTLSFSLAFWLVPASWAQEVKPRPDQPPAAAALLPNSEPTYQALRKVGLSGETVSVASFTLKRDAGVFTFRSGTFSFLAPVNGKVTGAVFLGDGAFTLVPPIASEGRVLALLTKEPKLEETFDELVLRFTDGTYEELKKQAGGAAGSSGGNPASILNDISNTLREKLNFNLASRILQDVLSPRPGGLFVAFIKGKKYSDKMVYILDPQGVPSISPDEMPDWQVAPEEVAFTTYEGNKNGVWAAFHLSHEYAAGQATGAQKNHVIDIEHQKLETSIEKSGKLSGKATTTFVANRDGLSVAPFDLYRTLRVQSVSDSAGQPLHFIQEDKKDDPDFAVILPKVLAKDERFAITTTYSGKEVVLNEGNGNYYPVARSSWYPNSYWGDYATYEMTFRVPKGLKMVATGILVSEIVEGDESISRWRTEIAQSVAGFNFGKFKREEFKLEQIDHLVESYANKEQANVVREIQQMVDPALPGLNESRMPVAALGSMDTTLLMKKALAEAQLSMVLFTDYFGPASYKRLAVTQQTAFNYGQSWPGVVWLPISYFFDTTVRHQLGMDDPRGYFKTVGPHEVAHQWWGHTVGFHSYRDQWISEGFAELAASLYIQMIQKKPQEFIKFWDDQSWLLTQKNKEGRPC